jgi:hypothetical protein
VYIELEVVPEHMQSTHRIECAVCGLRFTVGAVLANAYSNDGRLDFGPVCQRCLEGGPEEMAEQLEAQAEYTREVADQVERVAAEDIIAPKVEHLWQLEEIAAL